MKSTISTITRFGLSVRPSIQPEIDLRNALEHDAVAEDRRQREQEHHRADVDQAAFERLAEARAPSASR